MSAHDPHRLIGMDAANLADLYELPLIEWSFVTDRLEAGVPQAPSTGGPDRHTCWLATLDVDGSPHVTGIGALWNDGTFWFETGERTRKGRNLARDPRCSISVATHEFDLTVEGTAELVEDPRVVARIAALFAADGWPCEVDATGTRLTAEFSAPSAGAPPWAIYRVNPTTAMALRTVDPGGATRWTF